MSLIVFTTDVLLSLIMAKVHQQVHHQVCLVSHPPNKRIKNQFFRGLILHEHLIIGFYCGIGDDNNKRTIVSTSDLDDGGIAISIIDIDDNVHEIL